MTFPNSQVLFICALLTLPCLAVERASEETVQDEEAVLDVPKYDAGGALAARVMEALKVQEAAGFAGALLVAANGEVVFAGGVGRSGPEESSAPNTANTLFKPAGLNSTLYTGDRAPRGSHVATGHGRGASRAALEHPYGSFGYQYQGMGGVVTNVWDLWRWDRALKSNAILSEESKKAMFEPGHGDYGLGWFIREVDGEIVQSHGGSVRGFLCDMRRYPSRDACIIVLSNVDTAPVRDLAGSLDAAVRQMDSAWAEGLFGTYSSERGRSLRIFDQGGNVRAFLRWGQSEGAPLTRGTLRQESDGTFVFDDGSSPVQFQVRRADGRVMGVSVDKLEFEPDS